MSVLVGSRYEYGLRGFVFDAAGLAHDTVLRGELILPQGVSTYVVRAGDRLDYIAFLAYGRSDLWYILADANPDILTPDPLVSGMQLWVPGVNTFR